MEQIPCVIADLDVLPPPDEVHKRLAAATRVQRILKGLLKLSIQAQIERQPATTDVPAAYREPADATSR